MWRNHPFSQRNKATKRVGCTEVCVCVCVKEGGGGRGGQQNLKKKGVGNTGGLHKILRLATYSQLCYCSQIGQTYLENLASFAVRPLICV